LKEKNDDNVRKDTEHLEVNKQTKFDQISFFYLYPTKGDD
jgi:hypothetical protein